MMAAYAGPPGPPVGERFPSERCPAFCGQAYMQPALNNARGARRQVRIHERAFCIEVLPDPFRGGAAA